MIIALWVTTSVGALCVGTFAGIVVGRWSLLDRIKMLELDAQAARRFAGKLGDRIGRQRVKINELKKQLKTVATSTPAMAKPTTRPNLPH